MNPTPTPSDTTWHMWKLRKVCQTLTSSLLKAQYDECASQGFTFSLRAASPTVTTLDKLRDRTCGKRLYQLNNLCSSMAEQRNQVAGFNARHRLFNDTDECAGGNMIPTQKEVVSQFTYRNGGLYRDSTGRRGYRRPDGYVYTRMLGSQFGEHRLVHLMFTGEWPEQVDHINGVPYDNRPENLRSATHAQNCMNRKPMGASSKGCYWQQKRRKWIAQIGFQGKRITIGYYDTEQQAACAYAKKSAELHKQYGRTE